MARRALKQPRLCAVPEPVHAPLRAGTTVAYCYRVIRELSPGGMSQLYLIEHLPSGSYAALKVATRAECDVLAREYSLLQRVQHSNVVRAFDHGRLVDGRQYLVLELLPGADLAAWLTMYKQLAPKHALSVLWQLSSAIDHLHAQGVVHSDIKPANIMVNVHDERVTLIDFGVAFDLETERAQRGSSGTRGYMAPEQMRGQGCGPATDRYALAAVARELLGFTSAVATRSRRRVARPVCEREREPKSALQSVFRRALHPNPQERYASARNFVSALARAMSVEDASERAQPPQRVPAPRAASSGTTRASCR